MSATLLQLRDQIIIDNGILGNPDFPVARLNRIINLAQRQVQAKLNGLGMKKWETSVTISSVTQVKFGSSSYNCITANITSLTGMLESPKSIRFIECSYATGGPGIAYEIDENDFVEQLLNSYLTPSKLKPVFARISGKIYASPTTITGMVVHYYKVCADLALNTAETEIPPEFEEFIITIAGLEIQSVLGRVQDKQVALKEIESNIDSAWQKFIGKMGVTQTPKSEKLQ